MKLTTLDVVKTLPFDVELKQNVISSWDSLHPDTQHELERVIWNAYYELKEVSLQNDLETTLDGVIDGKNELSAHLYDDLNEGKEKQAVEKEHEQVDTTDLQAIRNKIEELMTADLAY